MEISLFPRVINELINDYIKLCTKNVVYSEVGLLVLVYLEVVLQVLVYLEVGLQALVYLEVGLQVLVYLEVVLDDEDDCDLVTIPPLKNSFPSITDL